MAVSFAIGGVSADVVRSDRFRGGIAREEASETVLKPRARHTGGVRVLVVEDDQEMAEATALGLRRQSKAVDVTLDGPSGFEHTVTNDDDVIVLDRDLPGMHGATSARSSSPPGAGAGC